MQRGGKGERLDSRSSFVLKCDFARLYTSDLRTLSDSWLIGGQQLGGWVDGWIRIDTSPLRYQLSLAFLADMVSSLPSVS